MGGRAPLLTSIVLAMAACGACGTTTPSRPPTDDGQPGPTSVADPTDCEARIKAASFDAIKTIDRVAECRSTEGGVAAAAGVLAAGGSRDAIWSALWIYDARSTPPVLPYLHDPDPSISAMAAAILASLGERDGLTVLLARAANADVMLGSHPPMSIGGFAIRTLGRLIVAPDAPSIDVQDDAVGAAAEAWQAWLKSRLEQLRYDDAAGEWNL